MKRTWQWIAPGEAARIEASGTTAYRIAQGIGEFVERFGASALVSARSPDHAAKLLDELPAWSVTAGWHPEKIYRRLLVPGPGEDDLPVLVIGNPSAGPREVVRECGLLFEVDFSVGYSVGLFCDQRENRNFLRGIRPARLLNTFAHTCAFSVAAAAEGAATVSVDASKSALQRGRRNFELNSLPLSGHKFVAEDVLAYLARLARRGETFDAIVLDPPTFGRGGHRRPFRFDRDFPVLLGLSISLAAPGARILLSTNAHSWDGHRLTKCARDHLPRGTQLHPVPPAPDIAGGTHPITLWAGPLPGV